MVLLVVTTRLIFTRIVHPLGGYPVPQLSDLLLREFPDPLTSAIWEIRLLLKSQIIIPLLKTYVRRILTPLFNPDINPELLCQDPTGLNLLKGSRPKDKLKRGVFQYLKSMKNLENEAMMEFLRLADMSQSELSTALFSFRPCHPRVMAAIYESTVVGQATKVVRKIDRTPVLLNLMINANDLQRSANWKDTELENERTEDVRIPGRKRLMSSLFLAYEENQFNCILNTLNQRNHDFHDDDVCSTLLAAKWREESWGQRLEGVTVPLPQELLGTELIHTLASAELLSIVKRSLKNLSRGL